MSKIKVTGTVVELDGDEMTRIMWQFFDPALFRCKPRVLRLGHGKP
jgi:isocitrate dehydrogenase